MKRQDTEKEAADLVLEFKLDASPEKVWRALSIPTFRECWLPDGDLIDPKPSSSEPGKEIRYRMREETPPFLESMVTFQIEPGSNGGTTLRIVHELELAKLTSRTPAANSNDPLLMRAA